jgi:hypothetical protein
VLAARRHRGHPDLRLGRTIGLFALLAAPFYAISLVRFGRHFLDVHIGINLLDRARGDLEGQGMGGGVLAYLRHLWIFDGPAIAIVLGAAVLAAAVLAVRRRDLVLGVPAGSALVSLVGLSLLGTRIPHYLLIFYPAAAICLGLLVAQPAAWLQRRAGRAAPVLVGALALTWILRTIAAPTLDGFLAPTPSVRPLASVFAHEAAGQPGPAYTLDWYAPAYAYYAGRPWRLLAVDPRMARIVGAVDTFADAHTVQSVPPWPPGRFLVAGPRDRVYAAPGLRVVNEVASLKARDEDHVLAVVEAEPPSRRDAEQP